MSKFKEKELISLKDAALASGYSADYIGQLIRSGKIPGKQVFTNISWMTTAEAVMHYKKVSKSKENTENFKNKAMNTKRRLEMELGIIFLILKNFKAAVPMLVILLSVFASLIYSIFYFANNTSAKTNIDSKQDTNQVISF